MTVQQLLDNTTSEELAEWGAYFRIVESERQMSSGGGQKFTMNPQGIPELN
jgi:hypothetical protein